RLRSSRLAGAAGQPDRIVRPGSVIQIMRLLAAAAAAAAICASEPAPSQPTNSGTPEIKVGNRVPIYQIDAGWICLPGRKDVCSTPLLTTELKPSGYGATGQDVVAKNPPI